MVIWRARVGSEDHRLGLVAVLSDWRCLQLLLALLQLQVLVLALERHQLLLVRFLHGLHRLLELLAVLAKLLVLG